MSFWSGRPVFVTGTTGFKGCWLAMMLEALGADVTGYALPAEAGPTLYDLAGRRAGFRHIDGDLRDGASLGRAITEAKPSVVLHLAAQALVRRGYVDPYETWTSNLSGSVELLEALRSTPSAEACVVVTTDKVYADQGDRAYIESDRLGGKGPYSASKVAVEHAVSSYRRSWGADGPALATARAGNTLGGGDFAPDRLLPDCVRAAVDDRAIVLRNPDSVRPWQHVFDVLWGYLLLAEKLVSSREEAARAWNFGPVSGDQDSVRKLATRVMVGLGSGSVELDPSPRGPKETHVLRLNSNRVSEELGWRPLLTSDSCLAQTVSWYAEWRAGADLRETCRQDIAAYLDARS